MPPKRRSTNSPSYVGSSDRSDGSDGDVAEMFSRVKRSTRIRKQQGSETPSVRPTRSTRATKLLRDRVSDVEFVSESAPSSRPSSTLRTTANHPAPARKGKPRSTFLGVYIPKLRPSPEMIRGMREKQAAAAEVAGNDDFVAVTIERGSSARVVHVESSVEDEDGIDNELGVALKRGVSNGDARPSPVKAGSRKKNARRPPAPDSSDDHTAHKNKGKQRRRDSDSEEAPRRKAKGKERRRRDLDDSDSEDMRSKARRRKDDGRRRKRRRNSDDDTADERLDDIELDEPGRFKTKSRLREVKKNAFQERLQSLQKKRRSKVFGAKRESSSEESSSEESSSEEDDRHRGRAGPSKNRKSSQFKYAADDLSDFIASDDDIDGVRGPRGRDRDRHELDAFTFQRETPEYKFKVVFQYLLVLVMQGAGALLPLRGKNDQYYGRPLRNVRDQMNGVKNSISSVLWRPEFVKALKKYPQWKQVRLAKEEDRCEACNRSKQACQHEAWLRGSPYHPEKHEDVYDQERADLLEVQRRRRRKYKKQGRESSSDSDDMREIGSLGVTCLKRTSLWHELHHWEHRLYNDIRHYYHDLLRAKGDGVETDSDSQLSAASDATAGAKRDLTRRRDISRRRVADLKTRRLPRDAEDVDDVTEWMDAQGYQRDAMRYLTRLEDRARDLDRR